MENDITTTEPRWKLILRKISKVLFIFYLFSLVLILIHSLFFYYSYPNNPILDSIAKAINILVAGSLAFVGPLIVIIFSTRLIKITKKKNFWTILLGIIVGLLLFVSGFMLWSISQEGLLNFIQCMSKDTVCF